MGSASSQISERRLSKNSVMKILDDKVPFDHAAFDAAAAPDGKISASQLQQFMAEIDLATYPDIQQELEKLQLADQYTTTVSRKQGKCPFQLPLPLRIVSGSHAATKSTAWLLDDIGGPSVILKVIDEFYQKVFQSQLAPFFRDTSDPHAARLANWIIEKMGGGDVWTFERRSRPQTVVKLAGGQKHVVHDRSSAHVAAWYSPKRAPEKVGQHFKLDDCRVWLRLMFWSVREQNLFEHAAFADWYPRFLGHFVRVYERTAPQFVRDSVRWSADQAQLDKYKSSGNKMPDVIGISYQQAVDQLPDQELDSQWPYDL